MREWPALPIANPDSRRVEALPAGGAWVPTLLRTSDAYILNHSGLDSYFFLRFLRLICVYMFFGCCLTWPVLFPVNATGGAGQTGLNILSFSNVDSKKYKARYYAHVFIAWIYIGVLLYGIQRELRYFITLRQTYLDNYADSEQSRTLLVTSVPEVFRDEESLARIYGPQVVTVTLARDYKELDELVQERHKVVAQLETAESKYIKMAITNEAKGKIVDTGSIEDAVHLADRYVPRKKRPTHKLRFLIGPKVDTIDWCRTRLSELNTEIQRLRSDESLHKPLNSAFILFRTRTAAQYALACPSFHVPLMMTPRYSFVTPQNIIWANLRFLWWERILRSVATLGFVLALIIFWTIPVAFVGFISNLTYITNTLTWLKFIYKLPDQLIGLITALLPTVMLAVLMALLPIILRLMAKWGGAMTTQAVELRVQTTYLTFQVVHTFIMVTLSSSAISVITGLINDPSSATNLLASNLPRASNFFISYIILQGLSVAGGVILQLVGLILFFIMSKILDNTPRKKWTRWMTLKGVGWGTLFPAVTTLAIIGLAYSCIAPLILGFTTVAFFLLYFAYSYCFIYVYDPTIDTTGLVYPRAVRQLMCGVYLLEVCLIGLFGTAAAAPHIVLMVILLVFTVFFHLAMNSAVNPLIEMLPNSTLALANPAASSASGGEDNATLRSETSPPEHLTKATTSAGSPQAMAATNASVSRSMREKSDEDDSTSLASYEQTNSASQARANKGFFMPPAMASPEPIVWIPRDSLGISQQEVHDTRNLNAEGAPILISDNGASIAIQGKKAVISYTTDPPDNKLTAEASKA